ncbi:MAG: fluoride efflux transporter CrcB [Anaerolineae bacterium]|nr:MAG: fluoride efflux transporter CrcB [Anaerolineae bacterium]
MRTLLLIGMGGFAGAILRYALSGLAQQATRSASFPYGTLVVNLLGCLVIGMLAYLVDARSALSPEGRSLLFLGVLGAFTTFSSYGLETFYLLRAGQNGPALANVLLNNVVGLGLVWLGHLAASFVWR